MPPIYIYIFFPISWYTIKKHCQNKLLINNKVSLKFCPTLIGWVWSGTVNGMMFKKYVFVTLKNLRIKTYNASFQTNIILPWSKFNCNGSMISAEYKVLPINKIILQKPWKTVNIRSILKVKSPSISSQLNTVIQCLSSVVMVLRDMLSTKWYLSMAYCCKNLSFAILGKGQFTVKVKIEGEKHSYIITAKHSYQYLSLIMINLSNILSMKWYSSMV